MEPIYTLKKTVTQEYLEPDSRTSLWALLHFAMDASGKHSALLGYDWETLAQKGMFWAVIRHRMQVDRYPEEGEVITVKTWPMPTTRSAYPRAVVGYDAQGREVFRLVSLWVLMDIHMRKMVLPGKSGITVEGILRGNELEPPATIVPQEQENITYRTVSQEDIDLNQHMNNARYLVWAQDLLSRETQTQQKPKEFVVCYLSEARLGQELALHWKWNPEGFLQVEGLRTHTDVPGKNTRVFAAEMYF